MGLLYSSLCFFSLVPMQKEKKNGWREHLECRFIPLETKDSVLLKDLYRVCWVDDRIFVFDRYPDHNAIRPSRQKYLHWQLLWNDDQSGYIQQLRAVENRIFDLFDAHKTEWEQNGLDTKEIQRLYKEVDKLVNKAFLGLQKS